MAANLAMVALRTGVPAASNALAKYAPSVVAKAKQIVAQATGSAPAAVNLGQVASAQGGSRAQLVAEAMVKAGMPVDELFSHIRITDEAELARLRSHFVSIEKSYLQESSDAATALGKTPVPDTSVAVQMEADCQDIEFSMQQLGLQSPDALMRIKVTLDHLNLGKIANYKVLRKHGRVR